MTLSTENKKVLVVDDEEMLVDMIKLRLEHLQYKVLTASDGDDGLILARQERPDLIILDIKMNRVDGYTMLREIRQCDPIKDTKVVMLTSSGQDRDLFEAEGISDFIIKPFDSKDFTARINRIFNPNGILGANVVPKAESAPPNKPAQRTGAAFAGAPKKKPASKAKAAGQTAKPKRRTAQRKTST